MNDIGRRYGKKEGMELAKKFFPEICPWEEIRVIPNEEIWNRYKDEYGDFAVLRVDAPIGMRKYLKDVNTRGFTERVPEILKTLHERSAETVVLVAKTKQHPVERYLYDGGFNVSICNNLNVSEIIVEVAGKGFDGHEVTRGLAIHETWRGSLSGSAAKKLAHGNLNWCERTVVTRRKYREQRWKRIQMLTKEVNISRERVVTEIPGHYTSMSMSGMLKKLISEIGAWLEEDPYILRQVTSLALQGNFVNGNPDLWQVFLPECWN